MREFEPATILNQLSKDKYNSKDLSWKSKGQNNIVYPILLKEIKWNNNS